MKNNTCCKLFPLSFRNHSLSYSVAMWPLIQNGSTLVPHVIHVWYTRVTLNMALSCLCFSNCKQSLIVLFRRSPHWVESKGTIWSFAFQGHTSGFLPKAVVFSVKPLESLSVFHIRRKDLGTEWGPHWYVRRALKSSRAHSHSAKPHTACTCAHMSRIAQCCVLIRHKYSIKLILYSDWSTDLKPKKEVI